MRCFSAFSSCWWAYGFTFTSIPPQTFPQICERWLKLNLMQVCKPCHYTLVEAVEPFKLHLMSMWYIYERFEHHLRFWMGIWLHTHTLTTTDASPDLGNWLKFYLMQVCKPCYYALTEDVEPFKLHPMSMSYIYEVFEHLLRLWMGIWHPNHTITTTDISPDLWEFSEILPDTSVQTMPLYLIEAVEPFKLHLTSMWYLYEVFERLHRVSIRIWLPTYIDTTTDISPDLEKVAEILPDASVQTMPLSFGWGCRTFQNASHVLGIHIWGVSVPSQVVDGLMASNSLCYYHRCFPRFGKVGWKPTRCKRANHATMLWLRL